MEDALSGDDDIGRDEQLECESLNNNRKDIFIPAALV